MIDENLDGIRVERLDDLPLVLALLYRMGVATLLDAHYPTHGNWAGELSFGSVACVWLSYILTTGDHRLCHLEAWAAQHQVMLEACLQATVRPLDFHDDRLQAMLDRFSQAETWSEFEQDLNAHLLRVYALETHSAVRLDTTSSKTYVGVSADGLFQYGYSSDRRPDLAQVKLSLASLDPLGLPLATAVVKGNTADESLYLPAIKRVQQSLERGGKTYIGDSKMDAVAIRAYLAASGDYYLCPLSKKQVGAEQLSRLIAEALTPQRALTKVYRPLERTSGKKRVLVAEGYSTEVEVEAEVGGESVRFREQRVVVRSHGFATQQATLLEKRLTKAVNELEQLNDRRRGKKRLSTAELNEAVTTIVSHYQVEGLVRVEVATTRHERKLRKFGDRAASVQVEEESRVVCEVDQAAVRQAKERLGWRVYGTNHTAAEWSIEQVVLSYREQYVIERGFARLKGKSLSVQPHYLHSATRVVGLMNLLVIGLRLLSLLEHEARKSLSVEEEPSRRALQGLYAGQRQRSVARPTSESMLRAFAGVTLLQQNVGGQIGSFVTPLTDLQKRILQLLNLSTDIYEGLASHFPKPNLFLSET